MSYGRTLSMCRHHQPTISRRYVDVSDPDGTGTFAYPVDIPSTRVNCHVLES